MFSTLALSCALVLLHATFRSPNLKARLSSVNEEFRAVWRGACPATRAGRAAAWLRGPF